MVSWLSDLRDRGMAVRLSTLGIVVLVALGLAVPIAFSVGGLTATATATLAAGLCLAGAAAALIVGDYLRGPGGVLVALWLGMILRLGVPFAVGVTIHLHGGPLARAGLLWYLLVFYPITLLVGTILSLPPRNRQRAPTP
jgi:hypothetical protein